MIAGTVSFSAGYLLGQAWSMYAFRDALAFTDALSVRLLLIVGVETAVAAAAFVLALRATRFAKSFRACVVALLAGIFTNVMTVGMYAMVPVLVQNDLQVLFNAVAVGLLSFALGWILAKLFTEKTPHAV
jgi:Kef-type K+ transport system membrane component KefB